MKILIADVWSVYNAGDRAILEGLLDGLRAMYPGAGITVAAHFPEGCASVRGVEVIADVLAFDEAGYQAQLAAPDGINARLDTLKAAYRGSDLVVSTGGYFLNATPGNAFTYVYLSRLLHFNWAADAGVPVAIVGQSLGPIEGALLRAASRATLSRVGVVAARDVQSFASMLRSGVTPHVALTADLAVDLAPAAPAEIEAAMRALELPRGALGISVRHYPGTPKEAFRDIARVADRVIRDYQLPVLLIGTTVPPEDAPEVQRRERELGNDDSLALREVHALMREKHAATVCARSLPPRLLKGVLSTCRAFVSTRMHAAILASTAGVPVAGLAYEFKVTGWFERLGLQDFVLPLAAVRYETLWPVVSRLLAETRELERYLARVIPEIQRQSRLNYELIAKLAPPSGTLPAAPFSMPRGEQDWSACALLPLDTVVANEAATVAPAAPAGAALTSDDPRRAWEKESVHYDVLHRRLRRIVQLAEKSGGSRLLDVGCSAGTVGSALSPRWTYHGCDVSETAVRSAQRGWLVTADLERGLPAFDEQPYDVIVCSGILEYLERPGEMLRALRARLAPAGRLIVSYFNMRHVSRRGGQAYRHPLWRNDYTPAEFRALLAESGWQIAETTWSTAGLGSAPDVRDEVSAVREEPADAAARLDDIGHTLIYFAQPAVSVELASRPRLPLSVVIPAYNRQDLLRPVLAAFSQHRSDVPFEVVVVDDGSNEPVRVDDLGDRFRLCRQENRGRAAAVNTGIDLARGEVVVICDSDIVPEEGFVNEHLAFHRAHRAETATHLGDLVWGVEPGPLGALLGARANPKLKAHRGSVDWTIWFTDNWSFKRSLFDRHAFRFDTGFKKWGWEELELAHRLARVGATNHASGTATGRHLKPIDMDGLLRNFAASVPNLLHLRDKIGTTPEVRDWLAVRMSSPELRAACERIVRRTVGCIESAWAEAGLPDGAVALVSADVSNALFRLGIQTGFQNLAGAARSAADETQDFQQAAHFGDLLGSALVVEKRLGRDPGALVRESREAFAGFQGGRLAMDVERRANHRVRQLAGMLAAETRPMAVGARR